MNFVAVLLIRWNQARRTIVQVGIFRLAVLLVLIFFVFATVYGISRRTQYAALASGVWAFLIAAIHGKRPDKTFLHISMDYDKLIYTIEYLCLSIPLFFCLLLHRQWLSVIGLVCFCVGTGLIKMERRDRPKTRNNRLLQHIPCDMYEWKAGVRQYFFLLITIWLLGLCTSFFVAGVPVAMLITGLLTVDFYQTNESWQILLSFRKSADQLLWYKIIQHGLFYLLLNIPLIAMFMIFHIQLWYIPVIVFITLLSTHIFRIVMKYAFYSHDRNTVSPVLAAAGVLIGLIPPLAPVLWLLSISLFIKARTHLSFYLNDYN